MFGFSGCFFPFFVFFGNAHARKHLCPETFFTFSQGVLQDERGFSHHFVGYQIFSCRVASYWWKTTAQWHKALSFLFPFFFYSLFQWNHFFLGGVGFFLLKKISHLSEKIHRQTKKSERFAVARAMSNLISATEAPVSIKSFNATFPTFVQLS